MKASEEKLSNMKSVLPSISHSCHLFRAIFTLHLKAEEFMTYIEVWIRDYEIRWGLFYRYDGCIHTTVLHQISAVIVGTLPYFEVEEKKIAEGKHWYIFGYSKSYKTFSIWSQVNNAIVGTEVHTPPVYVRGFGNLNLSCCCWDFFLILQK